MANTVISQNGNIVVVAESTTNIVQVTSIGPQGPAGDIASIDTESFTSTSSFNVFTSSYQIDSSSFNNEINNLVNATSSYTLNSQTSSMLQPYVLNSQTASFATSGANIFNGNQEITGSLKVSGSMTGSLFGTASYAYSSSQTLTASFVTGSIFNSINPALSASFATTASYALTSAATGFPYSGSAAITGSLVISGSGTTLQLIGSGSTILSISGSSGEIFKITDDISNTSLFTVSSGSTTVLDIDGNKNVKISGSLTVTGSISGFYTGYVLSDQTTAAGVDTTINNISLNISANEVWSYEIFLTGQVSGASGARFTVAMSSTPVSSSVLYTGNSNATGSQVLIFTAAVPPIQSGVTFWSAATTNFFSRITGYVVNGNSSNIITLKVQPINASQTVTIKAGSYMTARKIN